MLEKSFRIMKGIGKKTEKKLWESGITSWDDIDQKQRPEMISNNIWNILLSNVNEYKRLLQKNDFKALNEKISSDLVGERFLIIEERLHIWILKLLVYPITIRILPRLQCLMEKKYQPSFKGKIWTNLKSLFRIIRPLQRIMENALMFLLLHTN